MEIEEYKELIKTKSDMHAKIKELLSNLDFGIALFSITAGLVEKEDKKQTDPLDIEKCLLSPELAEIRGSLERILNKLR